MTRIFVITAVLVAAALARAAGPAFWDSPQDIPFTDGELEGAGLDAGGSLVPGLAAETALADSSLVLWTAAAGRDGAIHVASGHEGRLWRLDRGGEASLLADLPAEEIFALLPDGEGVLAGCGPGGQLFAIAADGTVTPRGAVPGGYAWDLERAPDGDVYVAAGSPAAVYRLGATGDPELVVELPASNALDLASRDDATLLVATQGPGRVFQVRPAERRWALLLAMDQDEGRQVLRGPDGWYAFGYQAEPGAGHGGGSGNGNGGDGGNGGSPAAVEPLGFGVGPFDFMVTADADVQPVRAALYRLDPPTPARVWAGEDVLTCVAWSDDHGWLAAGARQTGGPTTLYALSEPNGRRPVATWDGGDVLDLLVVEAGSAPDEIVAAQAHPGRLTRLRAATGGDAVARGAPLDGRVPVRWGRLVWRGLAGDAEPRFAVRTGESPAPDESWTEWLELGRGRDLDLAEVGAARVLQWRATLPAGCRVDAVTVSAFAPNLRPAITHFAMEPAGEIFQGGMMQSSDNATQRFADGLQVEYSAQSRADRRLDRDRAATLRPLRTLTWHVGDPNEDRLEFRLSCRELGADAWIPVGEATNEQVQTWDTSRLADGWYEVKLAASDLPDNPAPLALSDERILPPVPVDNTAPVVEDWEVAPTSAGFAIRCKVTDAFGPLGGADVELPDGSFERLDPVDGICDSAREQFSATVAYPHARREAAPRPWSVRARFWDRQGNLAHAVSVLP
ncbi:MAG TPA: hypothetical protein PLL30_13170 [Candidatus Krumholzibacteria bacterium]|nr:hypothetical protein [Candidatus Krumholzibacteria bacterium]HPD72718.1 hypothetical protein [Candidatus Krumholzibacteria bacterium]HRY40350.1 hypothetical protein [Candidatus Krumholzibacteria bacterium]